MALNGDIESLVLSGALFNPASSSPPSPPRTPSPDAGWHDDELLDALEQHEQSQAGDAGGGQGSIGMGTGRTGVKGVIRDRAEARGIERDKSAHAARDLAARMERAHLGGNAYLEAHPDDPLNRPRDVFGARRNGAFGHLREVGVRGFVRAVEGERAGVWVVVHLYDPSLERCYALDTALSRLARAHPHVKFVRARAAHLGFAAAPPSLARPARSSKPKRAIRAPGAYDDEDDPYASDEDDDRGKHAEDFEDCASDDDDNDYGTEDDVDLDVLPTLLAYRGGALAHTWVRADWEADARGGVGELLARHHILPERPSNCGFSSDEGDDGELVWGEGEGEE